MKPIILIVPSINQKEQTHFFPIAYSNFIDICGGIPVICSYSAAFTNYLPLAHGVMLIGGGDISPLCFQEEPKPGLGEISPDRDVYEMALAQTAVSIKMPIFGICRGAQVLSCALGGAINQDIRQDAGVLLHQQTAPKHAVTHTITVKKDSFLSALWFTDSLCVNSFHHQAISRIGDGLEAVAWAKDGIIEAVCHKTHPFAVGVQWHPEHLAKTDQKQRALFTAFVNAAKQYAEGFYGNRTMGIKSH